MQLTLFLNVCFLCSAQCRCLEYLSMWIMYLTEPVVQGFTLLNWLCVLFVSDNKFISSLHSQD